jgi:hypothetical protein
MKINFRCLVKGHRPADYTDSGYEICERCGAHEYHDGYEAGWNGDFDVWHNTIPSIFARRKFIIRYRFLKIKEWFYSKCSCCEKTSVIFGRYQYKDHKDCLPF